MIANTEIDLVRKSGEGRIGSSSLGKRVLGLRNSTGLTQEEFAFEAGLSQGYLSQIENGEVINLGGRTAIYIARASGAGYESFQEGELDTKVFLRPEARKLLYLVTSPELDADRRSAIEMAVDKLLPCIYTPVRYIDIVSKAKPFEQICKTLRNSLGKTQKELAESAELTQAYLSQIENGEILDPSLFTLLKISKALNIDAGELLGVRERTYPEEVEAFDRFLRNAEFTEEQKAIILNRFTDVLSLILRTPQPEQGKIAEILKAASGSGANTQML